MGSQHLDNVNQLMTQASASLTEINQLLTDLTKMSDDGADTMSPDTEAKCLQLILEYRLSNQDALISLLNIDNHLLYILGIQPQHSAQTNLERLTYALGSDDLKQILHALSQLVDHLSRIAQRYQVQQKKNHRNTQKPERGIKLIQSIQAIRLKQLTFLNKIVALEKEITQRLKYESVGPIYDHITALRGPISQFYQAMLHGLYQTQCLYKHINKHQSVQLGLDLLLKKTDQILQEMPSLYQPHPHYSLGHFTQQPTQSLEERAAAKRMRPFF